ncbi:MAG: bifunctional adenosylcobinamide kinase/adenosylcobinamide-phosphate guanylyltransferase [Eubacteriales bacterium]|nr:bifunctional adenosylcobinamide kinase/adenosylcobinamide-phosphate guanylyltransferase [Eubacteriales bacterium]
MFIVVTGGSGSGKSFYAEQRVLGFGGKKRYYIATMQCFDEESRIRIARHQKMRSGKGFETLEWPVSLENVRVSPDSTVLLECMSNLAANEYFDGKRHTPEEVALKIERGLDCLLHQCSDLLVVTNEVFSDGTAYDPETMQYMECLGKVNQAMARKADEVVEVVYGIPLKLKQ